MSKQYLITFNGRTRNGFDPLIVASRLARAMSKPESYSDRLLSGTPTVLMRIADFETANEKALQLHSIGAHTKIVEIRGNKNNNTRRFESATHSCPAPEDLSSSNDRENFRENAANFLNSARSWRQKILRRLHTYKERALLLSS